MWWPDGGSKRCAWPTNWGDGSDRLTAAVRAYAATGERRYFDGFERELKVDRTRDKALERLNRLGLTASELALLTEAKRNSDSLVSLGNRAFEAAGKKDFTIEIGVVYGEEYRNAKVSIMQPIYGIPESARWQSVSSEAFHTLTSLASITGRCFSRQ